MPDAVKDVEVRISIKAGEMPDLPDFATAKGDASKYFAIVDTGLDNTIEMLERSGAAFRAQRSDITSAAEGMSGLAGSFDKAADSSSRMANAGLSEELTEVTSRFGDLAAGMRLFADSDGNVVRVAAATDGLAGSVELLAAEQTVLNSVMQQTSRGMDEFEASGGFVTTLAGNITTTSAALGQARTRADGLSTSLRESGSAAAMFVSATQTLPDSLAGFTQSTSDISDVATGFDTVSASVSSANEQVIDLGDSASTTAANLAVIGQADFGDLVSELAELDTKLTDISDNWVNLGDMSGFELLEEHTDESLQLTAAMYEMQDAIEAVGIEYIEFHDLVQLAIQDQEHFEAAIEQANQTAVLASEESAKAAKKHQEETAAAAKKAAQESETAAKKSADAAKMMRSEWLSGLGALSGAASGAAQLTATLGVLTSNEEDVEKLAAKFAKMQATISGLAAGATALQQLNEGLSKIISSAELAETANTATATATDAATTATTGLSAANANSAQVATTSSTAHKANAAAIASATTATAGLSTANAASTTTATTAATANRANASAVSSAATATAGLSTANAVSATAAINSAAANKAAATAATAAATATSGLSAANTTTATTATLAATATGTMGATTTAAAAGTTALGVGSGFAATGLSRMAVAATIAQTALGPISIALIGIQLAVAALSIFKTFFGEDIPDSAEESARAISRIGEELERNNQAAQRGVDALNRQNELYRLQNTIRTGLSGGDETAGDIKQKTATAMQGAQSGANEKLTQSIRDAFSDLNKAGELAIIKEQETNYKNLSGQLAAVRGTIGQDSSPEMQAAYEELKKTTALAGENLAASKQLMGVDVLDKISKDGITMENADEILEELSQLRPGLDGITAGVKEAVISGVADMVSVQETALRESQTRAEQDKTASERIETELKKMTDDRAADVGQAGRVQRFSASSEFQDLEYQLQDLDAGNMSQQEMFEANSKIQSMLSQILDSEELSGIKNQGDKLTSGYVRNTLKSAGSLNDAEDQELLEEIEKTRMEAERLRNSAQLLTDLNADLRENMREFNEKIESMQQAGRK